MKKLLIITAISISLAGCANLQAGLDEVKTTIQKTVTVDNYDTVTALYGSAQAVLLSYRNACQRKVIAKACWKNIAAVQPYEKAAYNAYINARNFVRNNPTGDSFSLVQTFKNAVLAFQDAQTANGVK